MEDVDIFAENFMIENLGHKTILAGEETAQMHSHYRWPVFNLQM